MSNTEKHSKIVQDKLKLSLETTQEFLDMWTKNYQSTLGKLAKMPAFGPIREKQEKIMNGIPLYTNLYTTWIDSNINFQSVLLEAMIRTYDKTIEQKPPEDIKDDISYMDPEKYKEFYKIWIDTYGETFKEFMKSEHFASDAGKFMSIFMDFQKYNRETIEENYLKPNNLPTKTEIDGINKELYNLKKIIKELTKELKELSKEKKSSEINTNKSGQTENVELSNKVEDQSESPNNEEVTIR